MFCGLSVAAVIPAYNEQARIGRVLRTLPAEVDVAIVIDDASVDGTSSAALEAADARLVLLRHAENRGVGSAIFSGYERAWQMGIDVAVVMAGDGQMDPGDLHALVRPIAEGDADYSKGNRFAHGELWSSMPRVRLIGNFVLSLLTRYSSGYPFIMDSQCGYTAIKLSLVPGLALDSVYPRYGYPNDLLAHLHSVGARVVQVPVRPVYNGEPSGIRPLAAIGPMALVLVKSGFGRMRRECLGQRVAGSRFKGSRVRDVFKAVAPRSGS